MHSQESLGLNGYMNIKAHCESNETSLSHFFTVGIFQSCSSAAFMESPHSAARTRAAWGRDFLLSRSLEHFMELLSGLAALLIR